jgi:hypothetical protein
MHVVEAPRVLMDGVSLRISIRLKVQVWLGGHCPSYELFGRGFERAAPLNW